MEKGRFYTMGNVVPFSEDKTHEFKAHTNICVEDLPHWAFIKGTMRRTRRAVSRALNGFLNTGAGGTVYLGILDDGTVKGFPLTSLQKDHLQVAVDDLMTRYRPKVEASRYKVQFIPVVVNGDDTSLDESGYLSSSGEEESSLEVSMADQHSMCKLQLRSHKLRSPTYCWCDQLSISMRIKGEKVPIYVIEIVILPFKYRTDVDPIILQLHPLYEDEEGRVYYRRSASLHCMTHQDVAQMTRRQTKHHFEKILRGLRQELLHHEQALVNKHSKKKELVGSALHMY